MLRKRFADLVAAHGTDPDRWPENERDAALDLVASDPAARSMLEEARWLNDLLVRSDPAHRADMDRLSVVLPGRLPPQRRGWRESVAGGTQRSAGAGGRVLWPQVATLTMASLIGAMIGWHDPTGWFADPVETDPIILLSDPLPIEDWIL